VGAKEKALNNGTKLSSDSKKKQELGYCPARSLAWDRASPLVLRPTGRKTILQGIAHGWCKGEIFGHLREGKRRRSSGREGKSMKEAPTIRAKDASARSKVNQHLTEWRKPGITQYYTRQKKQGHKKYLVKNGQADDHIVEGRGTGGRKNFPWFFKSKRKEGDEPSGVRKKVGHRGPDTS